MAQDTNKQPGELEEIDFMEQGPGDSIPSDPLSLGLIVAGIAIGAGALYLLASKRESLAGFARNIAARAPEVLHH